MLSTRPIIRVAETVVVGAVALWLLPSAVNPSAAMLARTQIQAGAGAAIPDPIAADPVMSDLGLVLREVVTFPQSAPVPAATDPRLMRWARINHVGAIPDDSQRSYVPDLNGVLYVLRDGRAQSYLDVRAVVGTNFFSGRGVGSGLGSATFHPEFESNGRFYTVHTEAADALTSATPSLTPQPRTIVHGVITEWRANNPAADSFVGSRREVLRLGFASYVHGIQQIDFNPTTRPGDDDYGVLYVAVGDGGIGRTSDVPQDLAVPHGKILRINPTGAGSTNGQYGVPASNPHAGKIGVVGEIYALGMRNPHRFAWDTAGERRMLLGHIGQNDIEAIYDVRPGDNLGWSQREGPFVYNKDDRCNLYALPSDDARHGYTYPVAAYDHNAPPGHPCEADVGHAVGGGFVYRGGSIPQLEGKYLFTDIVDGRVMYVDEPHMRRGGALATIMQLAVFDEPGREVTMPSLVGDARVDLRIGRGGDGEAYLVAKANGRMWKVVATRPVGRSSQ